MVLVTILAWWDCSADSLLHIPEKGIGEIIDSSNWFLLMIRLSSVTHVLGNYIWGCNISTWGETNEFYYSNEHFISFSDCHCPQLLPNGINYSIGDKPVYQFLGLNFLKPIKELISLPFTEQLKKKLNFLKFITSMVTTIYIPVHSNQRGSWITLGMNEWMDESMTPRMML